MSSQSGYGFLREGGDEDEFIITREQARNLADHSYERGKRLDGELLTFPCVRKVNLGDVCGAGQVARSERLCGGQDGERFVLTRTQLRWLEIHSYRSGATGGFHVDRFPYERRVTAADDWGAEEVARAKWLHIVTANHLRKARKTIRQLKSRCDYLQEDAVKQRELIEAYRGQVGRDNPFGHVPEHYRGDGYVTCDRAIESASAQRCITERTQLQFWYWATALKYVWRMWSKEDPERDALKAIDCLEKAAGLGRLVAEVVE